MNLYHERSSILLIMNRLNDTARAQIIQSLCEGNSLRGTARLCDCAINTVVKLLMEVGPACSVYQHATLRGLNSQVVQCDEIWSFVGCKDKRATLDKKAQGQGDAWTWTAIDADSKLMITWLVGLRSEWDCRDFIDDLASRLNKRVQLSTDGFGTYAKAVKVAFGANVDYGMVIKVYGSDPVEPEKRYSPAICTSCKTVSIVGDPLDGLISTSYVERQNLNIRMGCRRFTRLTNAFSKKLENHMAAFSLYAMYYNFCRPHQTLTKESGKKGNRIATTPAMAAGVTDHVWTVAEMILTVLQDSK